MILGTRFGAQREDASLAAFYFASIGVGVLIVSLRGTNLDLMHVLLGTILAIDLPALILIVAIASVVVAVLALIFRPVAIQSFDPAFLRTMGGSDGAYRAIFLVLVVLDLVAGFQAFGTLLAGVPLLLPAAAARCWAQRIGPLVGLSIGFGMAAGYAGLLVSYHLNVPSGPAMAEWIAAVPMLVVLLIAIVTVHLPYGFSSIKLQAITAAGAQFGPPGFETDLLYLACLATLVLGGSGPLSIDSLLAKRREAQRP